MPVFRKAGWRALAVPTVILSNTPHYPTLHGGAVPMDWFDGLLQGLEDRGVTRVARAVVCGYLGQPAQADALARWLPALRAARPDIQVHIDPVMGDRNDGLYVNEGLVAQYRDLLVPHADGMTPNHFELELLVGRKLGSLDEVVAAARELIARGPRWIVATSAAPAQAEPGTLRLAVVTRDEVTVVSHPEIAIPPSVHGTGDVFMAAITAALLAGQPWPRPRATRRGRSPRRWRARASWAGKSWRWNEALRPARLEGRAGRNASRHGPPGLRARWTGPRGTASPRAGCSPAAFRRSR